MILNGFDKNRDPLMKTSERDPRYLQAYYPYYNPDLHMKERPKRRDWSAPLNRYTNNIYRNDQKPYYGPPEDYRVFNIPDIPDVDVSRVSIAFLIKIPIKLADLSDSIPSNKNIQELEKELNQLKNYVSGPKFLYDQTSKVYPIDAGAYYDPTLPDKQKRMKYLQERIDTLTKEMKLNLKPVVAEVRSVKLGVQNFKNKNKEETNGFIARSYYYPVGNSPQSVKEKNFDFKPVKVNPSNVQKSDLPGGNISETWSRKDAHPQENRVVPQEVQLKDLPKAREVSETWNYNQDKTIVANANKKVITSSKAVPEKRESNDDNSFLPKKAARDPPHANPAKPYVTTVQTQEFVPDHVLEKKASKAKVEQPQQQIETTANKAVEPILADPQNKNIAGRRSGVAALSKATNEQPKNNTSEPAKATEAEQPKAKKVDPSKKDENKKDDKWIELSVENPKSKVNSVNDENDKIKSNTLNTQGLRYEKIVIVK